MSLASALVALAATLLCAASASLSSQRVETPAAPGAHRTIRTVSADAQTSFDRGLMLFYGFNRTGARRAFLKATAADPSAAMPHVGVALAAGPNANTEPTPAEIADGCAAARTGLTLARADDEKAYASALVGRYCAGLTFERATTYAVDMGELFQRSPDDPDAATLYADSLMALRPRSAEQNVELVAVLELVLRRWPGHVGANHYYIHVVEGSRTPERGLQSAQRLAALAPDVGHLLHMPSHVYTRMGDHARAIRANEQAIAADEAYVRANGTDGEQVTSYHHNLESLAVAAGVAGRFAVARRAGTMASVGPSAHESSSSTTAHSFSPILAFVLLRFNRWDEVLAMPAPPPSAPQDALWYHFARAIAHAQRGRVPQATAEREHLQRRVREIPAAAIYRDNPASRVMDVLTAILDARIAAARGETVAALQSWERAVAAQDRLAYHEPPPIYYSVRESFGAALHRAGRFAEAEAVFREDLVRHPRNGRSLFGRWQTLTALGRRQDADSAKRAFDEAWTGSDVTLSLADF